MNRAVVRESDGCVLGTGVRLGTDRMEGVDGVDAVLEDFDGAREDLRDCLQLNVVAVRVNLKKEGITFRCKVGQQKLQNK